MRRSLVLLVLSISVVVPLTAGPPPEQILKSVLELDDRQLVQLQQLNEARRIALTEATGRVTALRAQLEAALQAENPDPAAVGGLVLAIRGVEKEAAGHQEHFRAAFLGILSDEQRQRAETFKFIRAAFLGGTALDELGL